MGKWILTGLFSHEKYRVCPSYETGLGKSRNNHRDTEARRGSGEGETWRRGEALSSTMARRPLSPRPFLSSQSATRHPRPFLPLYLRGFLSLHSTSCEALILLANSFRWGVWEGAVSPIHRIFTKKGVDMEPHHWFSHIYTSSFQAILKTRIIPVFYPLFAYLSPSHRGYL